MISYKEGNQGFNYRMAGICIHNGKVLLHKTGPELYWTLPGGRSELQEDTATTVKREFLEESGYEVEVGRPLWFVENFFDNHRTQWHEVSVFYKVDFPAGSPCLEEDEFYGTETDVKIIFKWFPLAQLADTPLYPAFLKEGLQNLPASLKRVVVRDVINV